MAVILFLILIINFSFFINIKLNFKQEEAIVIAFFGMLIGIYFLGIFEKLSIMMYVFGFLLVSSVIYNIYSIKIKKVDLKKMITMPSLIYYALIIGTYIFFGKCNFCHYDEFMFWGTNVKFMFSENVLWANKAIDAVHQVYPPITGIVEYLFCKLNNNYSEGMCYVGIISFLFTPTILLFKGYKCNIQNIIKVIVTYLFIYISINFFEFNIANLSVDCTLGILFSILVYYSYVLDYKNKKQIFIMSILCIIMTLKKTNGLLFVAIPIGFLVIEKIVELIKNKEKNTKRFLRQFLPIIIFIFVSIFSYLTWTIYYKVNGKEIDDRHDKNFASEFKLSEFVNTITGKYKNVEPKDIIVFNNFKSALKNQKIGNIKNIYWCILGINLIGIFTIVLKKKKLKNILWLIGLNMGNFIYLMSVLYIFMFVFVQYQGITLMGFERYINTYLLGFLLSVVFIMLEEKNTIPIILTICLGVIMSIKLNWQQYYFNNIEIQSNINSENIIRKVKENERVYIIDNSKDYGAEFNKIRYLIAPRKTNLLYEWNITTQSPSVYYQKNISKEELMDELIDNYDYVYVINVTNQFLAEYRGIFTEDGIEMLKKNILEDDAPEYTSKGVGYLFKIKKVEKILERVK